MIEIYSDGGLRGNPGKAACAFVIYENGKEIKREGLFLGIKTNNQAEYTGIISALRYIYKNINKPGVAVYYLDSELAVRQINGLYKVKSLKIKNLYDEVNSLIGKINIKIKFVHVKREKNKMADKLLNEILDSN